MALPGCVCVCVCVCVKCGECHECHKCHKCHELSVYVRIETYMTKALEDSCTS